MALEKAFEIYPNGRGEKKNIIKERRGAKMGVEEKDGEKMLITRIKRLRYYEC